MKRTTSSSFPESTEELRNTIIYSYFYFVPSIQTRSYLFVCCISILSVSVAKFPSIGLIYFKVHRVFCGFYGDCERYNEGDDETPTRKELAFLILE
jgi:hypothetical protein